MPQAPLLLLQLRLLARSPHSLRALYTHLTPRLHSTLSPGLSVSISPRRPGAPRRAHGRRWPRGLSLHREAPKLALRSLSPAASCSHLILLATWQLRDEQIHTRACPCITSLTLQHLNLTPATGAS